MGWICLFYSLLHSQIYKLNNIFKYNNSISKYMFFEDDYPDPEFVMKDNIQVLFYYLLVLFIFQYYKTLLPLHKIKAKAS